MRISIFGLGYVGCVGLGCLAEAGHNVIGVDINNKKVDLINNGIATISENKIDDLIKKHKTSGKIKATLDNISAVLESEVGIICVGTPNDKNGHLNMNNVKNVASEIAKAIRKKKSFFTIAIRSTVMPGTNKKIGEIIEKKSGKKLNLDFAVVSNPEFLREGSAVDDFNNPPYTVAASDSDKAIKILKNVYQSVKGEFIRTDIGTAEMIKLVNNSFHALKVSFANEIGRLCKELNIDSHNLMDLFVKDKILNISSYYLKPGFAYGGSCLPKDLKALNTISHDKYIDLPVLLSIDNSNKKHIDYAYRLIKGKNKKNIGFFNISFKPGTDDLRFSPSLELVERLLGKGYHIRIYDKNVNLSKLMGKNKEFLYEKLPHINKILLDDIKKLKDFSDLIIVTNKSNEISKLRDYDEYILDLSRINFLEGRDKYDGICW